MPDRGRIERRRSGEDGLSVPYRTQAARGEEIPDPGAQRVVVVVERLNGPPSRPLRRRDDALGLSGVPGERFLAEHMLARFERGDRPLGVQ